MTSTAAAGFRKKFDANQEILNFVSAPPLEKKGEKSTEEQCIEMEKKVTALMEESTHLASLGDYTGALDLAKQSENRERALGKMRESRPPLADQANIDLTYCVQFNLAVQYHNNRLYPDAINTYTGITKNKQYALANRLKLNMGNIYFELKKYPTALKMYKQALEVIPISSVEARARVMRNIGNAFVKMGQYQEAIASYEAIFDNTADVMDRGSGRDMKAAFNMLLCYYAAGNREAMKQAFHRLLEVRFYLSSGTGLDDDDFTVDDPEFRIIDNPGTGAAGAKGPGGTPPQTQGDNPNDSLRVYLRHRREEHDSMIIQAARLIAPCIERDWSDGYTVVIEALRRCEREFTASSRLASQLEMCRALEFLRHDRFAKATESLKEFEKKDHMLRARAAVNLAYLYFLEGDVDAGERYSDMALEANKFSAMAHVNRGNFHFLRDDFVAAKAAYRKALEFETDCIEAEYNLGLVNKKTERYRDALSSFERLYVLIPDSVEVLYQMAHLNELMGVVDEARRLFDDLRARVPTDPSILAHLGAMYYNVDSNEQSAVDYYVEAYRYLPVDLEVIQWLGAYFVRIEVYNKAMAFFERAAQIQPQEVKWQMLVANCLRRLGQLPQAKRMYEEIHRRHPTHVECLRNLVHLANTMNLKEEAVEWHRKMKRVEDRTSQPLTMDGDVAGANDEDQKVDMESLAQLLGQTAIGGEDSSAKVNTVSKRVQKKDADAKAAEKKEEEDMDIDLDEMLPT